MTTSAARSCPPVGSWIRRSFLRGGWATARWHLFTGDAIWWEDWPGPSLETVCGYTTGPLQWFADLTVDDTLPDSPCQLCLARAGTIWPVEPYRQR